MQQFDPTNQAQAADQGAPEETKTIFFRRPIKLGDLEYASVTLSEPSYAQLREAAKCSSPLEQVGALVHLNGKLPTRIVDQLLQRDVQACADFFGSFGDEFLHTSETSSPM